jgi:hypothetical protein
MPNPTKAKQHAIPPEQWDLPVSFDAEGKKVLTLRDLVEKAPAALGVAQLSLDQRAELTAERIERQPKFELAMVGHGIVTKTEALSAVRARSEVGKLLIEIETRLIHSLVERAKKAKTSGAKTGQTVQPG